MSTTTVIGRMPAWGSVPDFTDITTTTVVSADFTDTAAIRVVFEHPISDAQAAAVRRRLISGSPLEEALRAEIETFTAGTPDPAYAVTILARLVSVLGQSEE